MTLLRSWLLLVTLLLLAGSSVLAQQPSPSDSAPAASQPPIALSGWELEQVELTTGQVYRGLIASEDEQRLEFIEVRQPEGKPMYVVMRPIDLLSVKSLSRLPRPQRQRLAERIESFKNRAVYEQGQLESVLLRTVPKAGVDYRLYESPLFTLQSTADDEMTRRCAVRIEQIFAAYRGIVPPRVEPAAAAGRLTFLIFGSSGEYRSYLAARGWKIGNPAFFVPEEKLVVAGSELNRYARQLAQVRERHQALRQDYARRGAALPARLDELRKAFQEQQVPAAERERIVVAYTRAWEEELAELDRRIKAAERSNVEAFNRVAARMFARLHHEAFHAYLETYVFPGGDYDVPRWLNEGLAQVFETGLLDGDTLRIDAPHAPRLKQLQAELSSATPLPLAELLAADEQAFLLMHAGGGQASARHYLYGWGLAWYLTFRQPALTGPGLTEYVAPAAAQLAPAARFERLTQTPLRDFEAAWRKEMLELGR